MLAVAGVAAPLHRAEPHPGYRMKARLLLCLMLISLSAGCASRAGRTPTAAQTPGTGGGAGGDSAGSAPSSGPRPRAYSRVITDTSQTRRGMFSVHRVGDRLYF